MNTKRIFQTILLYLPPNPRVLLVSRWIQLKNWDPKLWYLRATCHRYSPWKLRWKHHHYNFEHFASLEAVTEMMMMMMRMCKPWWWWRRRRSMKVDYLVAKNCAFGQPASYKNPLREARLRRKHHLDNKFQHFARSLNEVRPSPRWWWWRWKWWVA